ncbi:hypothetical protein H0I29_02785 [Polaribacter sp. R2A056_3_33]|uniref:HEPN domain-containing protein n=1 Tax=Polaribacter sp. R2A056_3_33 TaxID=2745563 RepID=UPI001C4FEEEC|nr:HEPN domain-containing protein [Polaribacter sp. R2A056_3_33]QXP71038.1 hypothetical protein H0I29_02785 [Polaribacter sp. R2A056_3_33]
MKEQELNLESYKFVEKITVIEKNEPEKFNSINTLKGSLANLQVTNLSEFISDSPVIRKTFMADKLESKIEILIDNYWYGFGENNIYIEYYKFVNKLQSFSSFEKKLSIDYLNEKILLWIVKVHINKKSEFDLIQHLYNLIHKDVKETTFYFPILNLQIEQPFKVGNVLITYFEKEYFDDLIKKIHGENPTEEKRETFNKIYRKYQGKVFVAVTVKAENKKGKEIAYKRACLTADIIKLLSPTISFPDWECSTDLDKRMPFESEHLSIDKDLEYGFNISKSANNKHFDISIQMWKSFEPMINLFSKILSFQEKKEIEKTILNSIIFFSKSLSENDLHLRISQLIMIIESIFLLETENYKMEKKCKRRMSDLLYKNEGSKKQKLFDVLTNMYEIRHSMTHKSIKKYIEQNKLREFQINIIETFTRLITLSPRIDTMKILIEELDK